MLLCFYSKCDLLRIVQLLESEVLGQSTFGMKGSENVEEEEIIELPIRKTADVIKNITSNTPGKVFLPTIQQYSITKSQ